MNSDFLLPFSGLNLIDSSACGKSLDPHTAPLLAYRIEWFE